MAEDSSDVAEVATKIALINEARKSTCGEADKLITGFVILFVR